MPMIMSACGLPPAVNLAILSMAATALSVELSLSSSRASGAVMTVRSAASAAGQCGSKNSRANCAHSPRPYTAGWRTTAFSCAAQASMCGKMEGRIWWEPGEANSTRSSVTASAAQRSAACSGDVLSTYASTALAKPGMTLPLGSVTSAKSSCSRLCPCSLTQ